MHLPKEDKQQLVEKFNINYPYDNQLSYHDELSNTHKYRFYN